MVTERNKQLLLISILDYKEKRGTTCLHIYHMILQQRKPNRSCQLVAAFCYHALNWVIQERNINANFMTLYLHWSWQLYLTQYCSYGLAFNIISLSCKMVELSLEREAKRRLKKQCLWFEAEKEEWGDLIYLKKAQLNMKKDRTRPLLQQRPLKKRLLLQ